MHSSLSGRLYDDVGLLLLHPNFRARFRRALVAKLPQIEEGAGVCGGETLRAYWVFNGLLTMSRPRSLLLARKMREFTSFEHLPMMGL